MKYFQKILGTHIYLSPMHQDDAQTYVRWLNDFQVSDGLGASDRTMNIKSEQEWIEGVLSGKTEHHFAIVRRSDDKLLGNGSIFDIRIPSMSGEVGLFIGDGENRGQGYGGEALNLLVSYGFYYLNLNNIMLKVFSLNEQAIHVYEKVGFQEIGRRRKSHYLNGRYYDEIFMDILKEDYTQSHILNSFIK